jgi:hypothetical protein
VILVAHVRDDALRPRNFAQDARLVHGLRQRLLDEHVFAHRQGAECHGGVHVVRRGNGDRIEILPLEHPAIVRIELRLGEHPGGGAAAERPRPLHRREVGRLLAAVAMVDVAEGDNVVELALTTHATQVVPALAGGADTGDTESLGLRACAGAPREGAGESDPGAGGGGGHPKLTAGERSGRSDVGHRWNYRD